jgi:hypothetical protein
MQRARPALDRADREPMCSFEVLDRPGAPDPALDASEPQ